VKYHGYTLGILLVGLGVAWTGEALWPDPWGQRQWVETIAVAVLVAVALTFPLVLSDESSASLAAAPLLMGVLLLSPGQAVLAGVTGSVASDLYRRQRPSAVVFNAGMTGLSVGLSAAVYHALTPQGITLAHPLTLGTGMVAGGALCVTNVLVMGGMSILREGPSSLSVWHKTWLLNIMQDGGSLVLGYLGAFLFRQAWWAAILLTVPLALAYLALRRSVEEAVTNIRLAQQLRAQMHELRATQAHLIQTAKMASVGTLAAGIAHELANPLFAIHGRVELLLANPEKHLASEKAKEYLRTIYAMVQRASTIIRELLTFARADTTLEPLHIPDIIAATLDLVGKEITQRGVVIETQYDSLPPVRGIGNHLQQVFINLLLNARDAMPQGGTVTIRGWVEGDVVKVSVRDTGVGIPKDKQERLFEPFFTTKEPGKGTGLGLYICHRIITEEHGGRISIQSEEGKGTEVLLELPAFSGPAQASVQGDGRVVEGEGAGRSYR
jgi:signal transduction histidine kinase